MLRGNSSGVLEIHGARVDQKLIEGLIEAGDDVSYPASNLGKESVPGRLGDTALSQDVPDIVPFSRTNPAVSGEESASGGAL